LTRKYLSTDPRDKVFALMGIVTNPNSIGIKADYKLSAEEVYLSVAVHNLVKLKNLELLGNGGISSAPQNPKLPFWVPDWSNVNDRRSVIAVVARRREMCAPGDSKSTLSISADKNILRARGAIINAISQLDTTILIGDEESNLNHGTAASLARIALRSKTSRKSYKAFTKAVHKFPKGHELKEPLW